MNENQIIPEDILKEAQEATLHLLPTKSRAAYEKELTNFSEWKIRRSVHVINEEVLLAYFLNVKKKFAASSMWTKYSMLKTTLKVHENIDISKYAKLTSYLKSESRTYKPKKSKVLEREHIEEFFDKAPNDKYLMMKVPKT